MMEMTYKSDHQNSRITNHETTMSGQDIGDKHSCEPHREGVSAQVDYFSDVMVGDNSEQECLVQTTDPTGSRPKEKTTRFVYLLTFFSAIGGFLFGYDTGVVSGAMLQINRVFSLTTVWQELVVSVTIAGAALFAVVGGFSNDLLGRKPTILFASLVFTAGAAVLGAAFNVIMLLIGRIIVGFGIGKMWLWYLIHSNN